MSEKIRYEVDPYNRLIIVDNSVSLPRQRRVIEGVFAIGGGNSLEYRVKSPSGSFDNSPYQIKLRGTWSLTANHDLKLSLDKSSGGASGDSLTISGDLVDAQAGALLFSVTTKRNEKLQTTYLLEISGKWQIDENNRLNFRVRRDGFRYDSLFFEAGWEVDKNSQIIYNYEKSWLKRGPRTTHSFTLKGRWRIGAGSALSYEIDAKTNSTLDFKASYGIFRKDYIKYEVGIILSKRIRPVTRTITLYGSWRLKRGSALFFDVEYADGKIYSISFSAEARLTGRDTVSIKFKDNLGAKYIGIGLEINHKLLKGDGSAFMRALRSREETSILIGAGFSW